MSDSGLDALLWDHGFRHGESHSGGYGNVVILDHGNGFESLYGHAEDILVSVGDVVAKGDLIASMGSTGVSTGEHLHYEVRFAGEAVDPVGLVK